MARASGFLRARRMIWWNFGSGKRRDSNDTGEIRDTVSEMCRMDCAEIVCTIGGYDIQEIHKINEAIEGYYY
jgi:hypothetical protein